MEHAALRQRFVGTWKLVATRAKLTDGPEVPYGSDPLGYITYTDDGTPIRQTRAQDEWAVGGYP